METLLHQFNAFVYYCRTHGMDCDDEFEIRAEVLRKAIEAKGKDIDRLERLISDMDGEVTWKP